MAVFLLLKKIPREIWYLLGIVILGWYIYHLGQANVQAKWDASREAGKAIVSRLKQQSTIIIRSVETIHLVQTKVIKEKGDTVVKLIPQYLPADSNLPGNFRLLHDAAATGNSPEAPSESAEPVPIRTVASTVFGNYTTCHLAIQELDSVRSLYNQYRESLLAQCKQQGVVCSEDNPSR